MQTHDESKETAPMKPTGAALLRSGSAALVHGFGVSARDLAKLHVSGKHDECLEQLQALGGVRGVVDKLSSNSRTGIPADTDDIAHRKEGCVPCMSCVVTFKSFGVRQICSLLPK